MLITLLAAVMLGLGAAESAAPGLFATLDLPVHQDRLRLIVTGDAGATHSELRDGMLRVQWTKITRHFGPLGIPIYAILGNHDYGDPQLHDGELRTCGPTEPQAELDEARTLPAWRFPARSYVMQSSLVDIVMMDTQPIASGFDQSFRGSATAAQDIEFLRQEMAASHSKWRIVVGHHTIYSSGMHGRMNDPLRANMRALLPLLESWTQGADLYVCGHDHDLELIGDRTGHARPLFLISGAGSGVDVMKPRAANEPPTVFPQRLQAFLGFVVLDINPQTLTITFFDRQGNPRGMPLTMIPRSR